jgi:hypothetical protein
MWIVPGLRIPKDTADQISAAAVPGSGAFLTDAYPFPLTPELVNREVRLRAATGDEVTELLTTGGFPPEPGVQWPGDPALALGREVEWQIDEGDPPTREDSCRLWAGEVLLCSGQGLAGPFYIHEIAARAWAFSEALKQVRGDVFEIQVVPYACARSFAPALLREGEVANRGSRRRYVISPIKPSGIPVVLAFP